MRYQMPNYPCEFELPDSWLAEAGMTGFKRAALAYHSTADAVLIRLAEIEPPFRVMTVPQDWRGFDRTRMISILKGIAAGAEIKPVPLFQPPAVPFYIPQPYKYRTRDGTHRFYASIAAGFECLPCVVV
jgi:hypothetical protein